LNTNANIQEPQHEMHILVFICYLINIFSLFEYAQRKGNYIVSQGFINSQTLKIIILFFLIQNLGFTVLDDDEAVLADGAGLLWVGLAHRAW
jgi:hypothetical protein